MPLIKTTTKQALGKNIATEIKAGKPPKQAAAIAYSEQREAAKGKATPHHSSHSQKRSEHYHKNIVATQITRGRMQATKAKSQLKNDEDAGEEF